MNTPGTKKKPIFVSDLKLHCHHGDTVNNRVGLGDRAFGGYCAPPSTCVLCQELGTYIALKIEGEKWLVGLLGINLVLHFINLLQSQQD